MISFLVGILLDTAANIYIAIIVIYVLLSWFPQRGFIGTVHDSLGTLCEPYLGLFRRLIPPAGGIDFSPIVAVIVLELVVRLIIWLL